MHVHAPMKVSVLQDQVATFLLNAIGDIAIHKTVEFYYYSQDNRYQKINNDYPRFITEENVVNFEEDEEHDHDCDCDEEEEDKEIFTGDIFKDVL